jgi:prolipoprotein diacylglyceryltransferase
MPDLHPAPGTLVHPTQLYLALVALGIALVLRRMPAAGRGRPGGRFVAGMVLFAATLIPIESWRGDGRWHALGLSYNQWASAGVLIAASLWVWQTRRAHLPGSL